MSLFKREPKKLPQNSEDVLVDPKDMKNPETPADYLRRGYAYYARNMFPKAIADYQKAIGLDPTFVDAYYAQGMAYKAQKSTQEGIQAFKKSIELIDAGKVADPTRAQMLRRLASGHINEMTVGDWNLEKEIWQHEE